LGRNIIKEFRNGLEPVAATLEQLWISYNSIDKLTGLSCCKKLRVLFMSNNMLAKWNEIEKLVGLFLLL
jgi:dynein light chain 1